MSLKRGLLAVDIDGTLITDTGAITGTVFDALEMAVSDGWEIALASGRTFHAALPVARQLPFVKYAVLSNGACIIDVQDSSIHHIEKLDPEIVARAVNISREQGAVPALYSTNVQKQSIYYDTLDGACELFADYVNTDPRAVRVENVLEYAGDVLQIGMIAARDIIFSVRDALAESGATVMMLPFENPKYGGKNFDYWFIQVVARDARKHIAVRKLANDLNVPQGRIVAVGDNYNDTELISFADIGVAMGNAPDEVKALADMVVGTNNDSGLADVVNNVILSEAFFA